MRGTIMIMKHVISLACLYQTVFLYFIAIRSCNQEVFLACPNCLKYLCQRHYDELDSCDDHDPGEKGKIILSSKLLSTYIRGSFSKKKKKKRCDGAVAY